MKTKTTLHLLREMAVALREVADEISEAYGDVRDDDGIEERTLSNLVDIKDRLRQESMSIIQTLDEIINNK